METAENFLRMAAIVVTLLMAVLLLRDAGRGLVGRLAAAFSLGVAAYMICSSSTFHTLSPYVHLPILALCVSNPVLFWLLARALFDDSFRLVPAHGLIVVAFLVPKSVELLIGGLIAAASELVLHAAGFALAAHALWVACRGRADDLSEERRAFRLPFVIGVGVFSLILVVAETIFGRCYPFCTRPRYPRCNHSRAGAGFRLAPRRPAKRRAVGADVACEAHHRPNSRG
jgi:hypothetical protein